MPTLCNFDARPAVMKWFSDKKRRHAEPCKAAKQSWFKTVFNDNETSLPDCEFLNPPESCRRKF
jgi:hypothetical protein